MAKRTETTTLTSTTATKSTENSNKLYAFYSLNDRFQLEVLNLTNDYSVFNNPTLIDESKRKICENFFADIEENVSLKFCFINGRIF
jgi:hypothetical protein